jgi:hypothetical protein
VQRLASYNIRGGGNLENEKVFIAASLYDKDGGLLSGHWGQSVQSLVHILGRNNVFVSIYENDPSESSKEAMKVFQQSLDCDSSVVHEQYNGSDLPHAILPDGSTRVRRLPFLAEVRNRALRPLDDEQSAAYHTRWNKLLYLNDVAFDPIDAANLLFNTNVDPSTGQAKYRAACAVDFSNPFKFYDTFATRDAEGYDMGVPFYPWFTNAGNATSRKDVLRQTDAVRVKSCWGGMVAFEAKWFQPRLYEVFGNDLFPKMTNLIKKTPSKEGGSGTRLAKDGYQDPNGDDFARQFNFHSDDTSSAPSSIDNTNPDSLSSANATATIPPLRFRAETDTYWSASECCLIHADLAHLPLSSDNPSPPTTFSNEDTGIYLNPYIRVAYSRRTLFWLSFTKRFERLYPLIHRIINIFGRRPSYNPRQFEQPGEEVVDKVWKWDEKSLSAIEHGTVAELEGGLKGEYEEVKRIAKPGMFCGSRMALYMKEEGDGKGHWGLLRVPRGG